MSTDLISTNRDEAMAYSSRADRLLKRFGRNLQAARVMANYDSASDFAKALGVGDQAYRKYERGESMPPPDLLVDIRTKLGVSLDWLIANEKPASTEAKTAPENK